MKKRRPVVQVSVLPGQDPDVVRAGGGRVCIHLFVPDPRGKITEQSVTCTAEQPGGGKRLSVAPARGRIACDRNMRVAPVKRRGAVAVTMRTIEPGAVTCPKCIASEDYARITDLLSDQAPAVPEQRAEEMGDGSRTSGPGVGSLHGSLERLHAGDAE